MKKYFVVGLIMILCGIGIGGIVRKEPQNPHEKRFASLLEDYDATYNERIEKSESDEILRVYELQNNQKGYMVVNQGYEDVILMYVVLSEEGIEQVDILYQNETKDYGGYVEEAWFLKRLMLQVTHKLQVVKMKKERLGDVVAITGATMTSKAVVEGINTCLEEIGGIR